MKYISIHNQQAIPVSSIPILDYEEFLLLNTGFVGASVTCHCVSYFGFAQHNKLTLYCCIADDSSHLIHISASSVQLSRSYPSFTALIPAFEKFEREIHENFGLSYTDHPWLKPLRYPFNRFNHSELMSDYPFYSIESEELHEVGVGPVHAGIIEPGHFRFICNGEQILHLEIQLGYQHRGIEAMFTQSKHRNHLTTLAENIAGDSVAGHSSAFASVFEALSGFTTTPEASLERTIALEIERIAIHTGDLSAICGDIAYQLGNAVFGRLRTPMVNFFQEWCGNRLAKSLIRPGGNNFAFTPKLAERFLELAEAFEPDFNEMNQQMFSMASALSRFERTGMLQAEDAFSIGSVGMAARASGLNRDVRTSHPILDYPKLVHQPVVKHHGDVYSRVQLRRDEVLQSLMYIRNLLSDVRDYKPSNYILAPASGMFALAIIEGWRGEICHCAITGDHGELLLYKIKDPSFHNWQALALAVRNNEISDFPVCNKSFNLSYCGHDL